MHFSRHDIRLTACVRVCMCVCVRARAMNDYVCVCMRALPCTRAFTLPGITHPMRFSRHASKSTAAVQKPSTCRRNKRQSCFHSRLHSR